MLPIVLNVFSDIRKAPYSRQNQQRLIGYSTDRLKSAVFFFKHLTPLLLRIRIVLLSTASFRGFFIPKAWNMTELFIESEYHSIPHQFAEFRVANVDYIIDFSSDNDVIESLFSLDERLVPLLKNRKTYSVKFGVLRQHQTKYRSIRSTNQSSAKENRYSAFKRTT